MRTIIGIVFVILAATSAPAATITVTTRPSDRSPLVVLEGDLVQSDADEFAAKTATLSNALIAFNSDGGNLVAGIRIGELVRKRAFYTVVPQRMRCASACALAWLGGIRRFIVADGKIGFHAAYDAAGRETGVGNALVGAYLTKIGLPYDAVIYITQAAPNEMTWLNISDAARRGIVVTLLDPKVVENLAVVPTRYGEISVTKADTKDCCTGHIRYGTQKITIASAGELLVSLEGIYEVTEGDIVILSVPSGARGMPHTYYPLLVRPTQLVDLASPEFGTADGTFKVTQKGNEIFFDLGFEQRKRKTGIYKDGALQVYSGALNRATLPQKECATVLNMLADCTRIVDCSDSGIEDNFAMAGQRYFSALENMPVFKTDNFYKACASVCETKSQTPKQFRTMLCGY